MNEFDETDAPEISGVTASQAGASLTAASVRQTLKTRRQKHFSENNDAQ